MPAHKSKPKKPRARSSASKTDKRRVYNPHEPLKVTIRDVPPDLHARLHDQAERHGITLQAEMLRALEKAVPPADSEAFWRDWDDTVTHAESDEEILEELRRVRA